jgi:protein bicaudal C
MFDLPEDMEVDSEQVSRLMRILDVFISIRKKPKQNVVSVMIKGIERHASKLYILLQYVKNGYLQGYEIL